MNPLIKVTNVSMNFKIETNIIRALQNVSLEIYEEDFLALVGPSGSGKTTLLNLIGCLDHPSEGTVMLNGRDIRQLSGNLLAEERLKNIGFIFQDYNLIPTLSAFENVEFVLYLQKVEASIRKEKVRAALERVGLGKFLNRRPATLSRGQQQRVAVARAIVHEPKVVLGDELTANLDHKTGSDLMDFLRELNQKEKITFVYATHDPAMIKRAARVVELEDGKLLKDTRQ